MSQRNGTANGTLDRNGTADPINPFPNGRDPKTGHFTKGNKGGPGNAFARRSAQLKLGFLEAATPEKLTRLAEKLLEQALAGDTVAASLFLSYSLGKPKSEVDADRLDIHEWEILSASPTLHRLMACLMDCLPPERAVEDLKHLLALRATQLASERNEIVPDLLTAERQARVGK